jgi:hypothetical protein
VRSSFFRGAETNRRPRGPQQAGSRSENRLTG